MRIRSRRIHRSYRRLLLAACLGGPMGLSIGANGLAADEVGNELRILNAPAEATLEMQANSPSPAKTGDRGHVQLASDGWTARGGESSRTTTSPVHRSESKSSRVFAATPAAHADEKTHADEKATDPGYIGSGVQAAVMPETGIDALQTIDEPKSTLNFILPKENRAVTGSGASSNATKSEPPKSPSLLQAQDPMEVHEPINVQGPLKAEPLEDAAQQALEVSPLVATQSERLSSEMYGPGPQTKTEKPLGDRLSVAHGQAGPAASRDRQTESTNQTTAEPVATRATTNPEQNEPQRDAARAESDPVDTSELEALPTGDEAMELVPYYEEDSEHQAKPLEVRELKLRSDGSLGDSSNDDSKRKLPADTISNRSGSPRQSVGDGVNVEEIRTGASATRDSINAAGELKLSLGLPENLSISATAARLRTPLERTLNYYWMRPENATERTHWGMFHQMMIYDKDTQIIHQKQQYNAVAWMAGNNPCRDQLLYDRDQHGIVVKEGIGLQGHQAQMLAVFGLVDVPASYPIYVSKHKYTVGDVVQREMKACKAGAELTFTLIGLAHYIDTDRTWTSFDGEAWSFERLIQEELAQPVVGAACGGTHRLMGFAHALRRRRAEGKPITGQWARADKYVRDFIAYTWQLQNRDGSMSTAWFEGPEDNGKADRKIQTTGHMIEFLLTAVNDDELQSPQMLRAISYLNTTLYEERGHEWQVGPKGHALRALVLYYQRVYGRPDPWRSSSVASRPAASRR